MSIRLTRVSMTSLDGEVDDLAFARNATEIVGRRNSGKTAFLRVIDYCLGEGDSAAKALGANVADRYAVYRLEAELNGTAHLLERRPTEHGFAGKIFVNGSELAQADFSDWILDALGWPAVRIPKARNPRNATETTPLSFRTLLRHLLRKENSWSDFAVKEEEFHRRAVLRFFLGALDVEGDLDEFEMAQAQRRVEDLRERVDEAVRDADETLADMGRTLGLDLQFWDQLQPELARLGTAIEGLEIERQAITQNVAASSGYQSQLSEAYERLSRELAVARNHEAELAASLDTFQQGLALVHSETERLSRARTAIDLFSDVPVRQCPACGQDVAGLTADEGHCFLCDQPVTDDLRKRRIDIEVRSLADEMNEIDEQIVRTGQALESAQVERAAIEDERSRVAARLNDQRSAILAPFVGRLEQISAEVAQAQQSQAALQSLGALHRRITNRRDELAAAQKRLSLLAQAEIERQGDAERVANRCAAFARDMTTYLEGLQVEPWRFGDVQLEPERMTFLVDGSPWRERLGGESKVVFFLAYHHALLQLSLRPGSGVRAPGLAILDNPIQQGVPHDVVSEALQALEQSAQAADACLIATLSSALNTRAPGKEVRRLQTQYGAAAIDGVSDQ